MGGTDGRIFVMTAWHCLFVPKLHRYFMYPMSSYSIVLNLYQSCNADALDQEPVLQFVQVRRCR